jgi:cyclohexa-1,5-dienecarbonyl-CoA hydratase
MGVCCDHESARNAWNAPARRYAASGNDAANGQYPTPGNAATTAQTAMTFSTIHFHPGPRVASIVLNRPPVNVINQEMLDELHAAWNEVEDLKTQVVVFSGAGNAAFSAGVDIADHMPDRIGPSLKKFHELILKMRKSDCITIAAIHGHTLGGGAELAMMCDFIIAADDSQIGQPEISLACYPPAAAAHLPAAIGLHKASEMVLLGEPIDAARAEKLGLVNKVVRPLDLDAEVDSYVDKLLSKSSVALALAKRAIRDAVGDQFEKALARSEDVYLKELVKTEDMVEGVRSFIEKRPPSWKNR